MTVIALIQYKDGILLVSDSRRTHSILGIVDDHYAHAQKLTSPHEGIVIADSGANFLSDIIKWRLKVNAELLLKSGLNAVTIKRIAEDIKAEVPKYMIDYPEMCGLSVVYGTLRRPSGEIEPFEIEISEGGVTVRKLAAGESVTIGVVGTLREFNRLLNKEPKYDPAKATELDAEVIGYKLIKRMEKSKLKSKDAVLAPPSGKNVGDPVEFFTVTKAGGKGFLVDAEKAFEADNWENKEEMGTLKLSVDRVKEREIRKAAFNWHSQVSDVLDMLRQKLSVDRGEADVHTGDQQRSRGK
jgi:hypothetical protein